MIREAVISPDGRYRYRLDHKDLGAMKRKLVVVGVNPSTADADVDDATMRRVDGFATRLGYSHVIMINKFAWRTPHVSDLRRVDDPVGPLNDRHIVEAFFEADLILFAWGPLEKLALPLRGRWQHLWSLAGHFHKTPWCLGTARGGHPRHPLMVSYDTRLIPWSFGS